MSKRAPSGNTDSLNFPIPRLLVGLSNRRKTKLSMIKKKKTICYMFSFPEISTEGSLDTDSSSHYLLGPKTIFRNPRADQAAVTIKPEERFREMASNQIVDY